MCVYFLSKEKIWQNERLHRHGKSHRYAWEENTPFPYTEENPRGFRTVQRCRMKYHVSIFDIINEMLQSIRIVV